MTTTEQLERIKQKCIGLIACFGGTDKRAIAGWRSTIAAIEVLNPSNPALLGVAFSDDDNKVVAAILAAWPEELL